MRITPQKIANGKTRQKTAPGTFLVIEGTDGSGKGTQFSKLAERLKKAGFDVATFDFPRYDEPSSHFVKKYLNGDFGSAEDVGPYTGSLFYALDRYEAAPAIRQALQAGKIVLANRFTGSNMAHQGTKFINSEQRRGYFIWLDNLEFEMLKIPRPDSSIVLRVPAETAQKLVDQKKSRGYTDKKRDLHEADLAHLQKSVEVYDDLCQLFPKDFSRIDCVRDGRLLDVTAIHNLLWEKVSPLLPLAEEDISGAKTVATGATPPEQLSEEPNPFVDKTGKNVKITAAGRDYLKEVVTNADGNVYAFRDKLSPVTVAAAMARLSRRGDDMRVTLLDEFAGKIGQDEQLLHRVITAFGDDSVQQLAGQHVVVENASNLLTKKLEWGRMASYLEQSTRYIYFDKKDSSGKYKYFVPSELNFAVKRLYIQSMDQIFDLYSDIVQKLTVYVQSNSGVPETEHDMAWRLATRAQACDAARPVLPVATTATVGIFASGQALESLIMHLLADELPEAKTTGQNLLSEARQVMPTFLERADKPERGGATIAYLANTKRAVRRHADEALPDGHSHTGRAVTLTNVWPRNELHLIPDMLYEHSNLPLQEIKKQASDWPYSKKVEIFESYMGERLNRRHRPGRALEKAHYSWDLVCDYGIFRDLQRHRMVDDLQWQILTPRYGYDIPKLVEEAGLSEPFEQCFALSLALYSNLQKAGYELAAQYATLLGHKMRWQITYNAREAFHLHELRTSPQGHPGYRKLVLQMHEKLAEVHPLLAAAMKFVNRGEDPQLTRLAAERYTQFKIDQLGKDN